MVAEVVNLRRVRKGKQRTRAAEQAAENRARFGRPKAEKVHEAALDALALRKLDGHKRTPKEEADE